MRLNLTKPVILSAALLLFLASLEGGVLAWRGNVPVSTAPVFSWNGAPLLSSAPPPFGKALEMYRADRGAEKTQELPEGRKITLYYYEWDQVSLGPFVDVAGHPVELCNVEYGSFKLQKSKVERRYLCANGETLCFNSTWLTDPNGKPVFVYKISWIQGYGVWDDSKFGNRNYRFRRSFLRHQGAARLLEVGIFGSDTEDEAWKLVQSDVLAKLEWQ